MRSASCGVVIDPSTSDRSYGPRATARDASGKLAISISPATASNSSSQSSKLNWQPSQDANFQTASVGLCFVSIANSPLDFCLEQHVLHTTVLEHWAIFADKIRPILAMPAHTHRTFHVALHRDIDMFSRHAALLQFSSRETHHNFRATDKCDGIQRIKRRAGNEPCHNAHAAAPCSRSAVHCDIYIKIKVRTPVCKLIAIEDIRRCSCAIQQYHLAILFSLGGNMIHDRAQWGQTNAASNDHNIFSHGLLNRPVRAKRPAHADDISYLKFPHRP